MTAQTTPQLHGVVYICGSWGFLTDYCLEQLSVHSKVEQKAGDPHPPATRGTLVTPHEPT